MNNGEKLNELFSNEEFLEENKDADTFEKICEAVHAVEPDITEEEIREYLTIVSCQLRKSGELSEDELEQVSGGSVTLLAVAGGIITVCGAITACAGVGYGVGRFFHNWCK